MNAAGMEWNRRWCMPLSLREDERRQMNCCAFGSAPPGWRSSLHLEIQWRISEALCPVHWDSADAGSTDTGIEG